MFIFSFIDDEILAGCMNTIGCQHDGWPLSRSVKGYTVYQDIQIGETLEHI